MLLSNSDIRFSRDAECIDLSEKFLDESIKFNTPGFIDETVYIVPSSLTKSIFMFHSNLYVYYYLADEVYMDMHHVCGQLATSQEEYENLINVCLTDYSSISVEDGETGRHLISVEMVIGLTELYKYISDYAKMYQLELVCYMLVVMMTASRLDLD